MKRFLDVTLSILALITLSPLLVLFSLIIWLTSPGGVIYRQIRVGKDDRDFKLLKFRTMTANSDKQGLLTIGSRDPRITKFGYLLRKSKLDELPQLINIIRGDMSIVGPRPEVRKYVALYNEDQCKILSVRPGLTDYASLAYFNENDILTSAEDPEETYIKEIMPHKIELNLQYIKNQSTKEDLRIIGRTIALIFSRKK